MKAITLILFFCFFGNGALAQETLTLKYFGLAIHPFGDPTANLQPRKLDKEAHLVLNTGLFVGYEKFVFRDLISVKTIQGITTDCSNGLASISHLGVRVLLMKTKRQKVFFGIGPTLIVRESWTRFGESYTSSGFFNEYESATFGPIQWKFILYGLEFEYDYSFSEKNYLSVSITPGIPATTLSIGWKHWFNIKPIDPYKVYLPRKKK